MISIRHSHDRGQSKTDWLTQEEEQLELLCDEDAELLFFDLDYSTVTDFAKLRG